MDLVKRAFDANGIPLPPQAEGLFERYLTLFLEYNAHTNLSAIREPEAVVLKHFADSAELASFEPLRGRVLDIGTGGGFPGIPLKILIPELEVVLLDSVSKKTKACDHFVRELGLSGISVEWGRAEEVAKRPNFGRSFDAVVSRATAYLPTILEWAIPFLRPGGRIFLYKTPSDEELADGLRFAESKALKRLPDYGYSLAGQDRKILVFMK